MKTEKMRVEKLQLFMIVYSLLMAHKSLLPALGLVINKQFSQAVN
jgi:hypothetical protein